MFFSRIAPVSFAVLLVLFFAAPFAQARPEMAGTAADRFSAMDTNKDGKVSPEEFFAAHPNMRAAAFAAIDTDRDGFISLAEWEAFIKGHGRSDDHAHSHNTEEPCSVCPPSENAAGKERGRIPDLIMPPARP